MLHRIKVAFFVLVLAGTCQAVLGQNNPGYYGKRNLVGLSFDICGRWFPYASDFSNVISPSFGLEVKRVLTRGQMIGLQGGFSNVTTTYSDYIYDNYYFPRPYVGPINMTIQTKNIFGSFTYRLYLNRGKLSRPAPLGVFFEMAPSIQISKSYYQDDIGTSSKVEMYDFMGLGHQFRLGHLYMIGSGIYIEASFLAVYYHRIRLTKDARDVSEIPVDMQGISTTTAADNAMTNRFLGFNIALGYAF